MSSHHTRRRRRTKRVKAAAEVLRREEVLRQEGGGGGVSHTSRKCNGASGTHFLNMPSCMQYRATAQIRRPTSRNSNAGVTALACCKLGSLLSR